MTIWRKSWKHDCFFDFFTFVLIPIYIGIDSKKTKECCKGGSFSIKYKVVILLFLCINVFKMKKIFFSLFLMLPFLLEAQVEKTLKRTIELKMPGQVFKSKSTGEDSIPGTRGGAVVWHPVQKKYYAAFVGNERYPLAV